MRKVEDINSTFLCHVTAKAWIWSIAAALVTAVAAFVVQKKDLIVTPTRFAHHSTFFIAAKQINENAETVFENEKTDYKILRVAFDSEKEDAVKARYYELHSRNAFLTDYITLLSSQKFAQIVKDAYNEQWQKECPAFQLSAQMIVTNTGKSKDISRFIQISVVTSSAEDTEEIAAIVREQFKIEAHKLLGFNNIELFDKGETVSVVGVQPEINMKLPIALAIFAAFLVWGITLIFLLKRSPILTEEDVLFTIGTPVLTRIIRKKKQILPESAELCCRMLEKEMPEGQTITMTAPTEKDFKPEEMLAMAKGFAALGHNTLLIDCVAANGSAGISDFIEGKNAINEIQEQKENFTYISRGSTSRISTAHLTSKVFRDLVADMRMKYKTVLIAVPAVIDNPAVSLLDDIADTIVLTTTAKQTREKDLATAVTQLKNSKVKKIHIVLFT